MKVLTAAEMREVDRLTIARGIPGLILMENAGSRFVDVVRETFAPLSGHRVVIVCGKGNNGGDGFVIARQLFTRNLCKQLTVLELFDPGTLTGDALANRNMLTACGCPVVRELPKDAHLATLVIDAILGTGLNGPAKDAALNAIRLVNTGFPLAKVVAVDIPSGLPSDTSDVPGEFVKADHTVTFTAAKRSQCLSPSYEHMGGLTVVPIGSPANLCETNPNFQINQTTAADICHLFAKRARNSNKGMYGHVLIVGGSVGKNGAPVMSGLAAYRVGAGLVTIACPPGGPMRPELMAEPLEDEAQVIALAKKMTVVAIGPGLGVSDATTRIVKAVYEDADLPVVADADALNALAEAIPRTSRVRILTPHPGEMSRLTRKSVKAIQSDRLTAAQELARETGATIVLKGDRTLIAFPGGETWINPTGSPALAKGGTGDVLTGMIAGLVAQHPKDWKRALVAAVWLHGRSGELAGQRWGEESTLATDLCDYLPEAINEIRPAL